jgi:hypothetical protein
VPRRKLSEKTPFNVRQIIDFNGDLSFDTMESALRWKLEMKDLTESYVADLVRGQVVVNSSNPGFDVWKSELYPECTFQVKYAIPYQGKSRRAWTFHGLGYGNHGASWHIYFGIRANSVYPFLFSSKYIGRFERHASINIPVRRYGRTGLSPYWYHFLRQWPDDFHFRCGNAKGEMRTIYEQPGLAI